MWVEVISVAAKHVINTACVHAHMDTGTLLGTLCELQPMLTLGLILNIILKIPGSKLSSLEAQSYLSVCHQSTFESMTRLAFESVV